MLKAPARPPPTARVSQLLPEVKCSTCNRSVPLDQLGDHVCTPVPPVPAAPAKAAAAAAAPPAPATSPSPLSIRSPTKPADSPRSPVQTRDARSTSQSSTHGPSQRLRQYPAPRREPSPLGRDAPARQQQQTPPRPSPDAYYRTQPPPMNTTGLRPTTPSNAGFSPSSGNRPRTPSNASFSPTGRSRAPSNASHAPSVRARTPSNNSVHHPPQPTQMQKPPLPPQSPPQPMQVQSPPPPPMQLKSPPPPMMQSSPPPMMQSPPPPMLETSIGGEAGMAGVGRRAFQAAARAAMWGASAPHSPVQQPPTPQMAFLGAGYPFNTQQAQEAESSRWAANATPGPSGTARSPDLSSPSMDGRRPNVPPQLQLRDGQSASRTPPLSPSSGTSSSHPSPLSPHSPGKRSPSPINMGTKEVESSRVRMPFFDKFRDKLADVSILPDDAALSRDDRAGPLSPASEYSSSPGLAYDDESEIASPPPSKAPLFAESRTRSGSTASNTAPLFSESRNRSGSTASNLSSHVIFPSASDSPPGTESRTTSIVSSAPARSISSASAYSTRTASALRRDMEPVSEEPDEVQEAQAQAQTQRATAVKTRGPMRANTSPTTGRDQVKRKPKERMCVRCETAITDGRWVAMDEGGVLCERCWKNMYLPKCRRCSLPIEKAAVSSSDGQLKGKYHRECFNCHTCHKPFPDKSFYVFEGRPYCAYHYHEANESLCAAAQCGEPIEGPCAVSHTGDRYHPEHLTCEYGAGEPGRKPCEERLEDYWEVDGRMLCERHARLAEVGSDNEDEEDEDRERERRAMKRTTVFIDLANGGLR